MSDQSMICFDIMKDVFTRENYTLIAFRSGDTLYTADEPIEVDGADLNLELVWQCNHVTDESLWNDATCELPKTCSVEGAALGHSWTDATCDAPKTCDLCGATESAALGHKWDAAINVSFQWCHYFDAALFFAHFPKIDCIFPLEMVG